MHGQETQDQTSYVHMLILEVWNIELEMVNVC